MNRLLIALIATIPPHAAQAAQADFGTPGNYSFVVPDNVFSLDVRVLGGAVAMAERHLICDLAGETMTAMVARVGL